MRNLKKFFAVVVVIAMMITAMVPAFAAETTTALSPEAQACADLGMLTGDTGVTAAYTATQPTRIQSLVMALRLQGVLAAAQATPATADNFSDVKAGWMKPLTAYAKAHPEVGFVGNDGKFDPNSLIDAKQYYSVMLTALGYKAPADYTWETVATKAAAVGLKKLDGVTKVTINDIAAATVEALKTNLKDGSKTLAADLVAKGVFTNDKAVKAGVVAATPTALEVASVTATNLKEVDVKFNQSVDKASAENKDNYTFATGAVDSVSLLDDGVTARITLKVSINNQKENKISIKNVKAGSVVLTEVKDKAFTPVDNTLPTVSSVTALGTKAIKVVFSEPIKTAGIASFKIDGKALYGSPSIASREVIITPYDSSAMTVAEHTLTIAGAEDYFGLKSLSQDFKYTVVADTTKPTMSAISATLETVTVTFSEDVDPDTVDVDKVYYKNGADKIKANSKNKVAGNKYEFDFTGKALPAYELSFYVEGVKDYSGNEIAETSKAVKAVVDESRPAVTEVKVADDKLSINVKFSKKLLDASTDTKFFTLTDKDAKVKGIKSVTFADADKKILTVSLYEKLPEGTNKLKVAGIQDATTLKNTMLDYSTDLTVGDSAAPEVSTVSTGATNRNVIILFNEKMDAATISNPSNFIITFKGVQRQMPSDASFTVIQDSKAVLIVLPEKIGDDLVTFGTNLTSIQVMGVKDLAGNILKNFVSNLAISGTDDAAFASYNTTDYAASYQAAITGKNEVKLTFNRGIAKASKDDFTITGNDVGGVALVIDTVTVDNSGTVKIKTTKDIDQNVALTIATKVNNVMETVAGSGVADSINVQTANTNILDLTAPEVVVPTSGKYAVANAGANATITVPFNENLDATVAVGTLMGEDLTVTRLSDGKVLKNTLDYTTAVAGKTLVITVLDAVGGNSEYTVAVKENAKYIRDGFAAHYNYAVAKGAVTGDAFVDLAVANPTVTFANINTPGTATLTAGDTITIKFAENVTIAAAGVKGDLAVNDTFVALANAVAGADNSTWTVTLVAGDLVNIGFNASGATAVQLQIAATDTNGNVLTYTMSVPTGF